MGHFSDKTFQLTFTADFVILLVLFLVCIILGAALLYNPKNRNAVYKKRPEPNLYFNGAASYNGGAIRRYRSSNPFYQEDLDDTTTNRLLTSQTLKQPLQSHQYGYNHQQEQEQELQENSHLQPQNTFTSTTVESPVRYPSNAQQNTGYNYSAGRTNPSQHETEAIPLEPITLAVHPSVSR